MRVRKTVLGVLFSSLLATAAVAQDAGPDLRQPTSVRPSSYEYDNYLYSAPSKPCASPSDVAACPGPACESCRPTQSCESCNGCGSYGRCGSGCEGWSLPQPCMLSRHGIKISGWLDLGGTYNADKTPSRYNGLLAVNDRREIQMNQLSLGAERAITTEENGWDFGGRADVLYGTDYIYTQSLGWETHPDGTANWNRHLQYGVATPQAYGEVGVGDLSLKVGRFYTIIGYESMMPINNFFYSHTYTYQYGEPFTYTGAMAQWQFNERLSLVAGFIRGWDQWEDNNRELGFLGGLTWKNEETGTSIAFGITASNEQVDQSSALTMYSIVITQKLGQRWRWVLQHDGAHESNVQIDGTDVGAANWFGVVNYLIFDLNPQWSFGLRYEWFSDNDGTRVRAPGYPHRIDFQPDPPFGAYWNDVSIGFNYRPHRNVTLRSEGRWDWVGPVGTSSVYPFDNQSRGNQFLFATDLIIQF